jgi:hypothetical protein
MVEVNANDTQVYDDHINVRGFNILKFDYFDNKSKELLGFEGFAPRWTLLTKLRNTTNPLFNTSSLLLIIVSYFLIYDNVFRILKKKLILDLADISHKEF